MSNAVAYVQTDSFWSGQLAPNGLPVPWLLANFGTTNVNANADPDGDGMSNYQEYLAGTDPNNGNDYLHITAYSFGLGGTTDTLTWTSVLNRFYHIEETQNLTSAVWSDSGLGLISPDGASTTPSFSDASAPVRFYRVCASRPLAP